ncbi:MAG: DEAD/DEAH box helicase family protein [Chitinispirillales bacterium]|jgi:DNA polymerase III epsilon subunit family exonuclease|nr:DEAD/DEAH box helicase family protein [Chitinispirillales bacterium]
MPKLFDLLPDSAKKELIAEAKKTAAVGRDASAVRKNIHKNTAQPSVIVPDFVAVDVETTGLDFKNDRVIEIGAVKFIGGKPVEEFSTFINPGVPIPDFIARLTNISDDDVRGAPAFGDTAAKFIEFIEYLPLCGHQIEFDLTFINEELKRTAFSTISPQLMDTALFARVLLQHIGRFSLKHVCESLSISLDNAHRALYDAKASGEVAAKVIPMINGLPLEIRRALAAFAPGSAFKGLLVKSLGGTRYGVDLGGGTPLPQLPKIDMPEQYLAVDAGLAGDIFSDGGQADGIVKGFTPRGAQKEMALNVMEALNYNGILVAEAGTGTGKSLAYLVPAALHALKNNCRVIVSTHTRNLQDQLVNSDIPAASAICAEVMKQGIGADDDNVENLRFTKLKGRNNYLCRSRFYTLLRGELGNLSPRERNAVLPLVVWSQTTQTGDIEEQTFFNPKWFFKIWNMISADSQDCAGRRCQYYTGCFLQKARQLAQTSHIVVINHALFYSDVCSESSFLGAIGSIIFDEAHHLESSGHQHLRTEFDNNRATAFIDKLQNLLHTASTHKGIADIAEFENDLKKHIKHIRKRAQDLINELEKWSISADPNSKADYQLAISDDSLKRLLEPAVFDITLSDLRDTFHRFKQIMSTFNEKEKYDLLREEMQACAEQTAQLRADLQYLVAAKTEDHVFWIEGNREKKWTKLCGVPLDISELLTGIWERVNGGIVFTSATLATTGTSNVNQEYDDEYAPKRSSGPTTDYFKRAVGLNQFTDRTTSIILPSPYNPDQTLFGAFRNCPEPDNPEFAPFVADAIAAIHSRLGKNTLALFTSNAMLNNVYTHLKSRPDVDRNNLLAQGVGGNNNRNAMLEQFKSQTKMILLGTDSFWEGVDAPGEACEAVIIPRLPFPVPTHPLTQALGQRMEKLYGSSFFSYSVPEAIIKFRQGIGRLIRSASDKGILAVLDNRIVTKGYGKHFVRSVGYPINEFRDIDGMVKTAEEFFKTFY